MTAVGGRGRIEPVARWRVVTSLVLSLAGLGVSVYLTIDHFAKLPLACPDHGGVVTCATVTTSAESYFLHIPVALLGLCYYVVMVGLNLPGAWRAADRRVHIARLALAGVGIAFALYLVASELVIIGHICLWCTSVHVVTFLLFVLVIATVPTMLGWGAPPSPAGSAAQKARPGVRGVSGGNSAGRRERDRQRPATR